MHVILWDASNPHDGLAPLRLLAGHTDSIKSMAWHPPTHSLITGPTSSFLPVPGV